MSAEKDCPVIGQGITGAFKAAFVYEGAITGDGLEHVLRALDKLRKLYGIKRAQRNDVALVVVETWQNIARHGAKTVVASVDDQTALAPWGSISFGRDEHGLFVSAVCLVHGRADSDDLVRKYDHLRELSDDQLEREHRSVLLSKSRTPPNVGMGLLSLARNAAVDEAGKREITAHAEGARVETRIYLH